MKVWDLVKKVGAGAIRELPMGGLALDAINAMLPADKKLPTHATGDDAQRAIDSLPAEQRAAVMAREMDVQEEEIRQAGSTLRAALDADARSPHTTRPRIALGAFYVLAAVSLMAVGAWAFGIVTEATETVKVVAEGWPFLASVVAPFVILLRAYFGVLSKEQRQRLDAAGGQPSQSGVLGATLGVLLNRKN